MNFCICLSIYIVIVNRIEYINGEIVDQTENSDNEGDGKTDGNRAANIEGIRNQWNEQRVSLVSGKDKNHRKVEERLDSIDGSIEIENALDRRNRIDGLWRLGWPSYQEVRQNV